MKNRLIVIMVALIITMLCACQPTPDNPVVVGKDNNEWNQIMEGTNAVSTDYNFPANVTDTVQSTNLSATIDANVVVPDTGVYPVVKAAAMDLTQEQADLILKELVGDAELISIRGQDEAAAIMTKEKIIERIGELQIMLQGSDIDASQEESIKSEIASLQEQLDTAPAESEVIYAERVFTRPVSGNSSIGTISEEDIANMSPEELAEMEQAMEAEKNAAGKEADFQMIEGACDLGKSAYANIAIYRYDNPIYNYARFSNLNSGENVMENLPDMIQRITLEDQIGNLETSCQQAYQQALDALSRMGIGGMELAETAKVPVGNPSVSQSDWPYCYMFVFSRPVQGLPCTYALAEGSGQEQVSQVWPQEYIKIYIDDSGILQFNWNAPTQIGETVNENVSLKSFGEIMTVFKQQITNRYAYNDDPQIAAREIHIDKIKLSMMKIKMADGNGYLFVPVWDFFGYSVNTYSDDTQLILDENNQKTMDRFGESFLTINAIDGSVIDRSLGY